MTPSNSHRRFLDVAADHGLGQFQSTLGLALKDHFIEQHHGRQLDWQVAFDRLPPIQTDSVSFTGPTVEIGDASQLPVARDAFVDTLRQFMPWRKGPFCLFGTHIDTEWRSDLKWQRLEPHISPLAGRAVLDVGCGNGYYLFRMLGNGARLALGVDPTLLFSWQFAIANRFINPVPAWVLPLRSEHLPAFNWFDSVFSLGVLYHRRAPMEHLAELFSFLAPGGELVLETLVIDGDDRSVLMPRDRYAKMANVWFLPSTATLELWLHRAGFEAIRTVDVSRTTTGEQRATPWMTFQSLADFLDPADPGRTIEGYPAPTRAIVIARKKT